MSIPNVLVNYVSNEPMQFYYCEADILCPHCGFYTQAKGPVVHFKYALVSCHRCYKVLMIEHEDLGKGARGVTVSDYYPRKTPTVDPIVPRDIAEDFLEAQRCFNVGAWHGCAVMARRCMHSVAEHFKANGSDLYKQIADLQEKQIITPILAEQAQHVRTLGKHGAHPYDIRGNELKDLGVDDAQAALEFCSFIFDQVFVQPEKIKASQTRLTS